MEKRKQVLVIGSLNFDIILEQERLPHLGETYHVDRVTTGAEAKGPTKRSKQRSWASPPS